VLLHRHFLDRETLHGEKLRQKRTHRALVVADGLDVHEAPRELNGIEAHSEAPEYATKRSYNGVR
jgi:hypothetical protein